MVSAKATGVTQVDMYDTQNNVHSVQVMVIGDARELEAVLKAEFPTATLSVRPIQNAVILSGQVTSDEHVEQAVAIAEQFYPTVINRIGVIGMHTVMLHTKFWKFLEQNCESWVSTGNSASVTTWSARASAPPLRRRYIGIDHYVDRHRYLPLWSHHQQQSLLYLHSRSPPKQSCEVMADPTVVAIDGRPCKLQLGR